MDDANTVNDLLLYSGTLLVAGVMFAVMLTAFLGMLLLALAARGVQLVVVPLAESVRRSWLLWRAALAAAQRSGF
ncbi:hypothetical protein ACQCSX_12920 [Pseudarthrobacter sp. P1]|uniref:hypothetical protein n=1 Tax=Pseudarthrobacter sp. P1 TaxID=3418418 RepID=UPI003CEA2A1F